MSELGKLIPHGGGDVIPLLHERLSIGRRDSCDICLRFANISGVHCEMTFTRGCWIVQDSGSKNGIKVNGEKVEKKVLTPGDLLSIAKHDFTIQYKMSATAATLEDLSDDAAGIMSKPLLEKAGLMNPEAPRLRNNAGPGRLRLPPLSLGEDDDD
jgi:pSer/pThr/pTyr-binding forkhead associated (FHA) protein